MELLMEYDSDSDSGEANAQELENGSRSVYLITYSQADKAVFPTREDFALGVEKSFSTGKAKVVQWCCSEEEHRNKGKHYHIVVKLTQNQRWLTSKRFLMENYGVSVHYSSAHHDYYSAWRYVTKSDKDFVQSENHPRLREAPKPKTTNASRARCTKRKVKRPARYSSAQDTLLEDEDEEGERPTARKRKKRLTAFEVSQIMVEGNIKNLIELQALAFEQKEEGKTDLAEFLVNRTPRAVADMMQSTWEIEEAKAKLERAKKTRMELLQEARRSECAQGCNGDWLSCAEEILHNNGLSVEYFGELVRDLLSKGRGKFRNIMLTGPANCGKTFLLNPLTLIFNTFCNPASGTFAWIGAETAECIFLNDFRWCPQLLPWHDLLLLLEGHVVHLPAPKTHFSKDITFENDTPIFCTSKNPLVFIKNGVIDERETEMMRVRWKLIQFNYQIPPNTQRDITSCARCFATLILG
jgi:hypothetical protein